MFYPNFVESVPQLNQPYNVSVDVDTSDVPEECRLHRQSLDDKPIELWDDDRDEHSEYEHLLSLLYRQGVRSVRVA